MICVESILLMLAEGVVFMRGQLGDGERRRLSKPGIQSTLEMKRMACAEQVDRVDLRCRP